jgi:hypothetical protein
MGKPCQMELWKDIDYRLCPEDNKKGKYKKQLNKIEE